VHAHHAPEPIIDSPSVRGGLAPNYKGAVAIRYQEEKMRVFPHEFRRVDSSDVVDYTKESHTFQPDNASDHALLEEIQERVYYMRTRGLPRSRALVMVLQGVGENEDELPDIGHWEMLPQYRVILGFC